MAGGLPLELLGLRSRRIPTSVGRMFALEGKGRAGRLPFVALHGFASSSFDYLQVLLRVLPETGRLVAPDLPAHGWSETPEGGLTSSTLQAGLVETLDALVDEPAVLFGNSMGGQAAIRYAAVRPEKVAGLVLSSPGGARMTSEELDRFLEVFRIADDASAYVFLERLLAAPPARLLRKPLLWSVRRKLTRDAMQQLLDGVTPLDMLRPEELESLACPVLVLWGQQERLLPPEHLGFFERHLPPHARIEMPARFGHAPHVEHPAELAQRIRGFLAEVGLARAAGSLPPPAPRGARWTPTPVRP